MTGDMNLNLNLYLHDDLGGRAEWNTPQVPASLVRVTVSFGVDKASVGSYKAYYGARPNATSTYFYKALAKLGIKKGDFVVVNSPTHGLTVVTVVDDPKPIHRSEQSGLKWVIDKVDVTLHERVQELQKRAEQIQQELRQKANHARQKLEVRTLLQDDAEAVKMIKELEDLQTLTDYI